MTAATARLLFRVHVRAYHAFKQHGDRQQAAKCLRQARQVWRTIAGSAQQ